MTTNVGIYRSCIYAHRQLQQSCVQDVLTMNNVLTGIAWFQNCFGEHETHGEMETHYTFACNWVSKLLYYSPMQMA